MWTYLHFLKYDQNEHELITNQAIFIKQNKKLFCLQVFEINSNEVSFWSNDIIIRYGIFITH